MANETDYRILGDDLWERVSSSETDNLWYYRSLVQVCTAAGSSPLVDELARVVAELEGICERG